MKRTIVVVFFFNDTATTEIYTLSLHDALPILLNAASKQIHAAGQHNVVSFPQRPVIQLF